MEKRINTNKNFSIIKRAQSFVHALRGIRLFLQTAHNAWIETALFICTIGLGMYVHITPIEWTMIVLCGGFVLVAEAFNTAIEVDIDLTSPEYHPYARDTKDIAAGAVLLASVTAVVIGMIIFVPYLL
jgi:diacylglycerol kinase